MALRRPKFRAAVTLIEVMVTIVILLVAVLGASKFRFYVAMDVRKANTQITATRLASLILSGWKGSGGYSGYSKYELIGGIDPLDPNDYDPYYDYDTYNPDDYDYDSDDPSPIEFPELTIYDNAPGPAVPDGFSTLDSGTNTNYRFVVNGVNYYATLSFKDEEVGEPRILNVCVAWMNDYQTWTEQPYHSVKLTTYAND